MSLRADALRWLSARNIKDGHIVTSKWYAPDESWTKETAWWIQVPASAIRDGKTIHILCQAEPNAKHFRHLEVPADFFQRHLDEFATIGDDKINLFLSADEEFEFEDQRGPSHLSLAEFEKP
jgi:hypothetical protein